MENKKPLREDDATAISDFLLEQTGAAFHARDFETFSHWFHLPQTVGTFDGDRQITTRAELEAMFKAMGAHFDANGIVDRHRTTLEARFLDTDTVQATFLSRQVMRNNLFGEELVCHGLLKRIDGRWQVAEAHYATKDTGTINALLAVPE